MISLKINGIYEDGEFPNLELDAGGQYIVPINLFINFRDLNNYSSVDKSLSNAQESCMKNIDSFVISHEHFSSNEIPVHCLANTDSTFYLLTNKKKFLILLQINMTI